MFRAALILASFAALAAARAEAADFVFKFDAGVLDSDAGVASTYDRLTRSADAACGVDHARALWARRAAAACAQEIADEVVGKIGDRGLSSRHAAEPDAFALSGR